MGTTSSHPGGDKHTKAQGENTSLQTNLLDKQDAISQAIAHFNKGGYENCYKCLQQNCDTPTTEHLQVEVLHQMVTRAIDNAMRGDDCLLVFRLCKIDAGIQSLKQAGGSMIYKSGISTFVDYLLQQIHTEGTHNMRRMMAADDEDVGSAVAVATVTGLGSLYSTVGELIHEYKPLVSEAFGSAAANTIVSALYDKTTSHAISMLDFFIETYSLSEFAQQPLQETTESRPDPLQLDELLQTIALVSSYSVRFMNFVRTQAESKQLDTVKLISHIKLILGYYLGLEEQYMVGAITAAIHQSSVADNCQSTCVDDCFFVLRKCTRRALSTLDVNTACAVITAARTTMDAPFLATYTSHEAMNTKLISDSLLVGLNDLALIVEYAVKLKRDLEIDVTQLYTDDAHKQKIDDCIHHLASTNSITSLLKTYSEQYAALLLPVVDQLLFSYATLSYEMDEAAYEQADINDPFMARFIELLGSIFSPISTKLSHQNLIRVADIVARHVASKIEHYCFLKKYTMLGAVQFAKEVQVLAGYFISIGDASTTDGHILRHRFSRLSQISQLLNLDRVIDVMEYWVEGKSVFKLTPDEVKKVLARRMDFSHEAIAMLKLS